MNLGITGKWALVCGASKGLGLGCALALAREGAHVVIVARGAEALQAAAERLRADAAVPQGTQVEAIPADITTPEGRAQVLPSARTSTSSSPMPAARRPATSATGTAKPGSRPWTPTCSPRSS